MTARLFYEPDLANVLGYPFLLMYPQSPNAVFDPNENKQRIHVDYDPTNSLSLDLKTKNMELGTGGMPSSGTVTELEYKIGGKTYIAATGLKIDAVDLMTASQSGFSSFLSYLYDSFSGDIVGKGNKFDNFFEIGKGGIANIDGLAGDDTVYVWHQKNVTFDGGAGIDAVVFNYVVGSFPPPPNGVTIDLVTGRGTNPFGGKLDFSNVENITGTQNADTISGNGKANVLYGGLGGEDVIDGRDGNDTISLAAGLNGAVKFTCDGGAGKDSFIYDISFGPASSVFDLAHPLNNAGAFAHAQIKNFEIYNFNDFSFGSAHPAIHFVGTKASETIKTAAGDDVIEAGVGNDTITGGLGANSFVFSGHFDRDEIVDFSLDPGNIIEFAKSTLKDFADVMSHAHRDGLDVVIEAGHGDTLRLDDIKLTQLEKDDFLFA